jgi:hypothetical protein
MSPAKENILNAIRKASEVINGDIKILLEGRGPEFVTMVCHRMNGYIQDIWSTAYAELNKIEKGE